MLRPPAETIGELLILWPACPHHVYMVSCLFQARPPVCREACLKRGPDDHRWGVGGCAFFTSRPCYVARAGKLAIFLPAGSQTSRPQSARSHESWTYCIHVCRCVSASGCSSERLHSCSRAVTKKKQNGHIFASVTWFLGAVYAKLFFFFFLQFYVV